MSKAQKIILFLLRISIGWLFFYAGITKILDHAWSASGYLSGAQTGVAFYAWLNTPTILPIVNTLNAWGLALIGGALILGLFVRWASVAGMLLMVLYYIPILTFPYVGEHSYLVDEHIMYLFVLASLIVFRAGYYWGFDALRR